MTAFPSKKQTQLLIMALAMACTTACSSNKSKSRAVAEGEPAKSNENQAVGPQSNKEPGQQQPPAVNRVEPVAEPALKQPIAKSWQEAIEESIFVAQKNCAGGATIKAFRSIETRESRYLVFVDLAAADAHGPDAPRLLGARMITVANGIEDQVVDESFDLLELSKGPWESMEQIKILPIGPAAKVLELQPEGSEAPELVLMHAEKVRQVLPKSLKLRFELAELSSASPVRAKLCDRVARFGTFDGLIADSALFGVGSSLLSEKSPLSIQFVNLLVARGVTLNSTLNPAGFKADLYLRLMPDSTYELGVRAASKGEAATGLPQFQKWTGRFEVSGEKLKLLGSVAMDFVRVGQSAGSLTGLQLKLAGAETAVTSKEPVAFELRPQAFAGRPR